MELVFICSPYKGDIKKNTENAKKYCRWVGYDSKIPFAPHLYFTTFLDESSERWKGLWWSKKMMKLCSEIDIFCNELTEGMITEIEEAKTLKLKMRFYNEDMEELTHGNYLIHREIGPGYGRVIADYFGDCFYPAGCTACSKCGRDEKSSKDEGPEAEPASEPVKPGNKSFWDRLIGYFR